MGGLRAAFARNKKTLAIAGAGLVVVIAFIARKRAGSSTTSSTAATTYGTGLLGSTATSSTPYSTYTPYDSTGSDITGALQSNTEALQQLLASTPVAGTTDPTAQPSAAAGEASAYEGGYVRNAATGGVLHVVGGQLYPVKSAAEFAQLGTQATNLPGTDPIFGLQAKP